MPKLFRPAPTRRHFLRTSAALVASTVASTARAHAAKLCAQEVTDSSADIFDVAIVGGGVAGIYSGWRLITSVPTEQSSIKKIALFEGSHRLGGRLLSVIPPGIPNTYVELGGMRYTPAHTRVVRLVKHLGLKADDFPVSKPENIVYVRGKMLRRQDLVDANAIPYNLAPDERDPQTLDAGFAALAAQRAAREILGKDVPLHQVDWAKIIDEGRYYNGKALSDLPMQYVIQRNISQEAFRFAEDTSGYDSILRTWNAADGFPWNLGEFGGGFFHLQRGFQALPLTMARLFQDAGGTVFLRHFLTSFDQVLSADGSIVIEMCFRDESGRLLRRFARKLILAMPRRALELLDQTGAVLGPENTQTHKLIRSVTPIPLFKLAICYPSAWWERLAPVKLKENGATRRITVGQSITDLPIRQCYYWAKDEESGNAVLLIYDDGSDLDFWAGLRTREQPKAYEGPYTTILPEWDAHKAPRLMVEEAHRQLALMHGVEHGLDIPSPYAAAYRDWGEDPFGGGANFWHLHVNSKEVSRAILQPKPPVPVYICGEAYSHNQGWVEGPLETADKMLEMYFGLPPPSWPN
jgi:hypothetical protein